MRGFLGMLFGSRATGESRRTPTLAEADRLHEFYSSVGIVDGTPGTLTDRDVHRDVDAILSNRHTTVDQKLNTLDAMTFAVYNNHTDGMAAHDALNEISEAWDKARGQ